MRQKKDWKAIVSRFNDLKKAHPYESNMAIYTKLGVEFGANPDYIRKKMNDTHPVLTKRDGTADRNERIRKEYAEEVRKYPSKPKQEIRQWLGDRYGIHEVSVFRIVQTK